MYSKILYYFWSLRTYHKSQEPSPSLSIILNIIYTCSSIRYIYYDTRGEQMQLNLHTSYKEKLGMLHYLSRSIIVIPIDCFRLCLLISLSFLCQDENEKKNFVSVISRHLFTWKLLPWWGNPSHTYTMMIIIVHCLWMLFYYYIENTWHALFVVHAVHIISCLIWLNLT